MIVEQVFKKGSKVLDALENPDKYICCKVDGKVKELNYVFDKDTNAKVEFLDLTSSDAARMYDISIRYLLSFAVRTIDPKLDVRFFYNISRSIFVRVIGKKGFKCSPSFVRKVETRMKEIVAAKIPFERIKMAKNEALELYKKEGYQDKIQVLKYRNEDFVHLYKAVYDGKEFYDYLYGYMVPSSSYLDKFQLRFYSPGMILQIPRADCNGNIPPFVDEAKFALTLASTSRWAEENQLDTVSNINRFIKTYGSMELINVAEARINNMLAALGEDIVMSPDPIRCICVAGPSSSGKTSFANRLMFELMSHGLRPIRISIDDFYIPRNEMKEGTDLESIEALDVDFFNEVITNLIQGEEVALPHYDFKTSLRTFSKPIRIKENQPIIMEGIHALNDKMTESIPAVQKYKIYIAPQPQVNLDYHTPLSMTDMRLLRRISRDARTRDSDAKETISMWPNVRGGEFKYIYPTQENADFVFDSFLPYELCAIRNIVLPLLEKIKPEDEEYLTAIRLRQMVRYFLPIPTTDIPCNSLMREFVGGSSFKDAR